MGGPPSDSKPTVNERSGRGDAGAPEAAIETEATRSPEDPAPRYARGEEIARGGMGRVVEAMDTLLGRRVALKEALTQDADARRRFARETRITARLEHPSIVPVHDAGTTPDGTPFYVMRKVTGRPLEDLVVEADELSQRLALVPHVLAAAQAIAHAHERSVLHRDLKPSNILVGNLGETVVIDWGLAKVIDEPDEPDEPVAISMASAGDSLRTRVGTVFGTPGFMSPEQLRGETVDPRSDVYALGATLYYVLARRPPHAATTGDDMMVAALAGPPQPIRELAPGVPAELTTIIDKALAHDDRTRYPHAGALVEDLRRFLTGQLVAAHRYSRRERLVRFVRRHKLPVAISALAVATIAIVATMSVRQVIGERERTNRALADALDRNEQLVVVQAQTLLATNPTAAVATIKPIAAKRWRDARAIGMAAHAAGVVRGYPASRVTSMVSLTRDGTHAISVGTDGVVRRYDLAAHTTSELVRIEADAETILVDNDRGLLVRNDDQVSVIDLATGNRRVLAAPSDLREIAAAGNRIWYVTDDSKVFEQALDSSGPERSLVDDAVELVAPAPTGPWVAYAGTGLWLQRGADPPAKIAEGRVFLMDWSPDGSKLVAAIGMQVLEIVILHDVPRVTMKAELGRMPTSLASFRNGAYWGGFGMLYAATAARPERLEIRVESGAVIRMIHGYRDSLLAVSGLGRVSLLGDQVRMTLVPPAQELRVMTASPTSPYVVVAIEGVILVWDLAALLPEIVLPGRPTSIAVVGTHQLVATYFDQPTTWLDLDSGQRTPLAVGPEPMSVAGSPHGDLILVTTLSGVSQLIQRKGPTAIPITARLQNGFFDDRDHLFAATVQGEILIYAPPAYQPRRLFEHAGQPLSIGIGDDPQWLIATYVDGTIWRLDQRSQRAESIETGARITWSLPGAAGDVWFAVERTVKRWQTDGSITTHATLPRPMTRAFLLDEDRILVVADDQSVFEVRIDARDAVASRFPPGTRLASVSPALVLSSDSDGAILAADPATATRWTLARSSRAMFGNLMMTPDSQRVFALGHDNVLMWRLGVPRSAEDTVKFLDSLTNARAPTGAAALTWD